MAKERMPLDEAQAAAVGADLNCVVRAGAGSGKTRVIAERFARLAMERGLPLESILTLTFTRKAANEMRSRIRTRLMEAGAAAAGGEFDFDRAEIGTFDSFCARVARAGCARWGFSPDFSQDEAAAEALAADLARRFLLERRGDPVIAALVSANDFETAAAGILGEAAKAMSPARPVDFSSMANGLRAELEASLGEGRARMAGLRDRAASFDGKETPGIVAAVDALSRPPPGPDFSSADPFGPLEAWCAAIKALRKPPNSGAVGEALEECRGSVVPAILGCVQALENLGAYRNLYAALGSFQDEVIAAKREAGILSYADAAAMAREILVADKGLRGYFKRRYRAIMVDEFQDDNALQKEILYLLAEKDGILSEGVPPVEALDPGKLFFVGDEKQSIYRFRGADVSVFRSLAEELRSAGGALRLDRNYRSSNRLVAFFNAAFERIMAGARRAWEAEFEAIKPAGTVSDDSKVLLLSMEEPSGDGEEAESGEFRSPRESEAWAIADLVLASIEGGSDPLMVAGEGGPRPARADDVAILLRSTSLQSDIERIFRLKGLPYSAQDACSFWLEAPANDFLAVLRCATYPGDAHALAVFLRSPFCAMDDAELAGILADRSGRAFNESIEGGAGADASEARRRACAILSGLRGMAGLSGLADMVSWLWHENGYREFVMRRRENHGFLEYFDYLFELARRSDRAGEGLPAFIARMEALASDSARIRDLEPQREGRAGVRIMTVHKSKGLEFPIVVIPSVEYGGMDGEARSPSYWWKGRYFAARMERSADAPADRLYALSGEERKDMEAAELKRLFYVACTRARDHLVLAHSSSGRGSRPSFLDCLQAAMDSPEASAIIERRPFPRRTEKEYLALCRASGGKALGAADLSAALAAAGSLDRSAPRREYTVSELNAAHAQALGIHIGLDEEGGGGVERGGAPAEAGFSGVGFGTLVHELIRAGVEARLSGAAASPELGPEALAALDSLGDKKEALSQARALAAAFLDSGLCARALSSGSARVETPFLLRAETKGKPIFVRGAIDLLFEEDGACVVVDYKTNAERRSGEYEMQMGLYSRAARALTGKSRSSAYLYYLRAGGAYESPAEPDPDPAAAAAMDKKPGMV